MRGKHPARTTSAAAHTDGWVILFTGHPDWLPAVQSYATRWATEGSYRDAQGGYDGKHGWDLEPTLSHEADAHVIDSILGLWALGSFFHMTLGEQVGRADAPLVVQQARARWTTTGRLSVWMRGRFALTDPFGDLRPWLLHTLAPAAPSWQPLPTSDTHSLTVAA